MRIAVTGGTEQGGAAVSPQREPHLGYGPAAAGEQTGEDKQNESWRRNFANLFAGMEGMPSNSRIRDYFSFLPPKAFFGF